MYIGRRRIEWLSPYVFVVLPVNYFLLRTLSNFFGGKFVISGAKCSPFFVCIF
jgi:hypothetical protein